MHDRCASHRFAFTLALLIFAGFDFVSSAAVRINEFMASNTRAYPDITDFEDYPDWIELKNSAAEPVSLGSHFLSDDLSDPFKWRIPAGTTIPANGFLLIMADGHNAAPGQSFPRGYWPWSNFITEKYHANFSLAAEGEKVSLIEATGLNQVTLIHGSSPVPTLPATAAVWRFKDDGSDLGTQWRASNYDDAAWSAGPSKLGYGDPAATVVSFGPSTANKFVTTYFRHKFQVSNPSTFHGLTMRLLVDDGCIVYLNGTEVVRRNIPTGKVNYQTFASKSVSGSEENRYFTYSIPRSALTQGDNVIAVEVHQEDLTSSDLGFDLELVAEGHDAYTMLDFVTYTQQVPDVSFGRDQEGKWTHFAESTPGAENGGAVLTNARLKGDEVAASLPGGFYSTFQNVTLSSAGGIIYYTLDGANPTTASARYSTPLQITNTTVLRARSIDDGKPPGPILTETYFIGESISNLAYVSIVADPETLFGDRIGIYKNQHEPMVGSYGLRAVYKNKDAPANIEFFGPDGSGFSVGGSVRIGGENNWVHPQKALNIALRSRYGDDSVTYDLFPGSGIPVHSAFTLRDGGDNWDSDMLKDALYPKLTKGFMEVEVADYRPSIVFINGEYFGLHDIRQRWDDTWFAQQFHIPADKIDHLIYGHVTSSSVSLGSEKGTADDWNELLQFLNSTDLTLQPNWEFLESRIDINSFMDFVIGESYGNNSSWYHNREFWKGKTPGAKWRWFFTDMDRTFSQQSGVLNDMLSRDNLLSRLRQNPAFRQRLAQRYAAHMASTFKASRVHDIVNRLDGEVSPHIPRHSLRWAPLGTTEARRNNAIANIKYFATLRETTFAAEVSSALGVGAPVDITLALNEGVGGTVLVQGIPVAPSTFKMFSNTPFTLQAVPAPGFAFAGWLDAGAEEKITVTADGPRTFVANFVPSGETVIGGVFPGEQVLTAASSPYVLSNDLVVPSGATLTVQEGVTILCSSKQNIRVQGTLRLAGSKEKPIQVIGRAGARWGGISFEETKDTSTLQYVIIRGATKGFDPTIYNAAISGRHSDVEMSFLDIRESEKPIYMYGGNCALRDSIIHNPYTGDGAHFKRGRGIIQRSTFLGNNAPDTDAIDFDGVTGGVIEDCHIYRFQGSNSDGIDVGEATHNLLVQGNKIYFNSDKGISVGQGSSVTIRRNLIVGCNLGVGLKDQGSEATIDHNTFVSCNTGVALYEKNFPDGGGSAVINHTIFSKTGLVPVTVDQFSNVSSSYNLSDTTPLAGQNNLLADPKFVDPVALNFQLQPISPAIDAGNPLFALDADNTRTDIGAYYLHTPTDYPYSIEETVVINEVLANSGAAGDWIEIHNRTHSPVDIGGWFLSDDALDRQKYRIPHGTIIPADGYLVFHEDAHFGSTSVDTNKITAFALSATGETLYLSSAWQDQLTDYLSKEDFGPSSEGETLGTYYKKSSDSYNFVAMAHSTPGAPNSSPRVGPVVISEIMYNPDGSGTGDAEYIELLNISSQPVSLYDAQKGRSWRMGDGIDFEFPSDPPITLSPGERLILTRNTSMFARTYGALLPANTMVFQWGLGSLNNGGETLELQKPGPMDEDNIVQFIREDRVNFDDQAPWSSRPDGHGPSLTKVVENGYGNDFMNWMAASPTPGSSSLQSAPDRDSDGMPDAFELAYQLNPDDASDALTDLDEDGQNNLAEFLGGLNPADPRDGLRISVRWKEHRASVTFNVVPGRAYVVQCKNALTDATWMTVREIPEQPVSTEIEVEDSSAGGARFYRLMRR